MNNDAETPVNQKVVWDMIKINEQDKDTIIKHLQLGFEPFALLPVMVQASAFDPAPKPALYIYFKRPSLVNESDVITPLPTGGA